MIKVLTVLGTRPEAIKLAPVLHALERDPEFDSRVVVTGQHREMLDPMLELFEIEPDHDLAIMSPRQTLSKITMATLAGLEPILLDDRPDWVVVQGDTTSAMAASMAAFYQRIPIGHVEAGLRTFDKYSPFPEEINRRVAGVLADLHFAPTPWAQANLLREGVPADHVHLTGNTVIDAMHHVKEQGFDVSSSQLAGLNLEGRLVVVTTHRNENFGDRMESIAIGIRELAARHREVQFVYPLHLNPRARVAAEQHLDFLPNVALIEPLEYQEMVWALHYADLVLTDSGGIQEEAAAARTPVLVLRDTTERPEGIEAGIARLVGPDHTAIVDAGDRLLRDGNEYAEMSNAPCPYGDGHAAARIVDALAGRPQRLRVVDHIYERPSPQHPMDALLRHATANLPRRYADEVLARARDASNVDGSPMRAHG
jgi:UDP-N-acetylglucosamine 2-epimerase (non-hydrolysing)